MAKKELDRFDKNAKRGVSISAKLITIIGGAMLVAATVSSAIALYVFNKGYINDSVKNLDFYADGIYSTLDCWRKNAFSFAELLADDSFVIEKCVEENKSDSELQDYILSKTVLLKVDGVSIASKTGTIIAASDKDLLGKYAESRAAQKALSGVQYTAFEKCGSVDYAMVCAVPIKSAGSIVGAAIAIYDLSSGALPEFARRSFGAECTIFKDNLRIDTTILDEYGNKAVGTTLQNADVLNTVLKYGKNYTARVNLFGKNYYAIYTPVKCDDGTVTGMVFLAKSVETVDIVKRNSISTIIPAVAIVAVVLMALCGMFVRWLMRRIRAVSEFLTEFLKEVESGEGDLTKRCKLFLRDEIGDLVISFDFFLDKLHQIIKEMKETKISLVETGKNLKIGMDENSKAIGQIIQNIESVNGQTENQNGSITSTATSIAEISQNISQLNGLIENQSAGVAQASTAIEQMIGNIASVNGSVEKMAGSFKSLSQNAGIGFKKQQDVNEKIKEIESQSEMLLSANQAISDVAAQTNLLAMNAAIEAAHAGEAGKGFSVVAEEIRKLSETSSSQSKTIGDQLNIIRESISNVFAASSETSEALSAVSMCIAQTEQIVMQIRSAMEEQQEGSKQITSALKSMNGSTVEVASSSKEMSERSKKIMDEVSTLENSTEQVRQSVDEMTNGANRIEEAGGSLEKTSANLQEAIDGIGARIDLFKV